MVVSDNFNLFMPFDVIKSEKGDQSEPEMRIAGYASTSDKDRQNDIIIQKGLDISNFVNYGYFNYDHNSSVILGYPDKDKTKIDSKGFWVEGVLLPSVPLAKSLWETAVALKKSHAPRKLGFSVEGKTLKKDASGRILKAAVYHVAITPSPVNTSCTWDALVKSFSDELLDKSMEAGYSTEIGEVTNGASLKVEDLERCFKILAKALGGDEEASKSLHQLKEHMGLSKSMDSDELILYYQLTKGLSYQESRELAAKVVKEVINDHYTQK